MLKTLGRETKGFRLVSILTPIFMICEVIMEMIIPKLMASIIDDGVTPGNMQKCQGKDDSGMAAQQRVKQRLRLLQLFHRSPGAEESSGCQ